MKSSTKLMVGLILVFSLVLSLLVLYQNTSAQTLLEKASLGDNTIRIQNSLKEPIVDVKLIENTEQCLGDCHVIIKLHPYQRITFPEAPNTDFRWDFLKGSPEMLGIKSYHFQILENVSYVVSTPIFGKQSYDCIIDNATGAHGTCWEDVQTGVTQETRYADEYKDFDFWGKTLDPGKDYYIKVIGEKYPTLGENNVDWIPTIMGVQINEWYWWNGNWTYRQKYESVNYQGYTIPQFRAYVEMDTATEISAGRMNPNCSSIRAGNDTTEFQHYFENCNTTKTGIYVVIPWYVNGPNDFYIYWDSKGFSNSSNASVLKSYITNLATPSVLGLIGEVGAGFPLDENPQLFVFGGYNGSYQKSISAINYSDSTSNVINATLPTAEACLESSSLSWPTDNSVYIFGGMKGTSDFTKDIVRFNDTNNVQTATKVNSLGTARRNACVVGFHNNNEVLIMGGAGSGTVLDTTERYYTDNNTVNSSTGYTSWKIQRCASWAFDSDVIYPRRAFQVAGWTTARTNVVSVVWPNNFTISSTSLTINTSVQAPGYVGWEQAGNNLLYVLGGDSASGYVSYIWEFNVTNMTVQTLNATMSTKGGYWSCARSDKSAYCANPYNGTSYVMVIERFDMRIPSAKVGSMEPYNTSATESEGDEAIVAGIQNALGTSIPIYPDQQVYVRYLDGSQTPGQFDEVVISGNQTWAFNYITAGESYTYMDNLSTVVYVWEKENLPALNITSEVSSLINGTKFE